MFRFDPLSVLTMLVDVYTSITSLSNIHTSFAMLPGDVWMLLSDVTMLRLTPHVLESVPTKVLYFTNQQSNFTSLCCFSQIFVTYRCVVLDPKCMTLN